MPTSWNTDGSHDTFEPTAAASKAAQWEDICTFAYDGLGPAAWTELGDPYAVTADSGSVGGEIDHVIQDGLNSLHGPDGSKGIAQTSTTGSLKFFGSADAVETKVYVADLLGRAPTADDLLAFTVAADGAIPATNYEAWGLYVGDDSGNGFCTRAIYIGPNEKVRFGRVLANVQTGSDVIQAGVRLLQIVIGLEGARFGYETSNELLAVGTKATQFDTTKDYGTLQTRSPGSTVHKIDYSTLHVSMFSECQGDVEFVHIFKSLQAWKGVPQ